MIEIKTDDKYVYSLNGEDKEMDFPSIFEMAEYFKKSKSKDPLEAVIFSKDLLLKLGMEEVAVRHLKVGQIKELFTETGS